MIFDIIKDLNEVLEKSEIFCHWNRIKLDSKVEKIAVGAGYGNSILKNVKADIFITGEVTHHEIIREVHRGVSFIVTDHSDTERGYNYMFRERFLELLKKHNEPNVEIIVSEKDRDPLEYI